MPTHRSSILSLLRGDRPAHTPVFSGLSTVLAAGLEAEGLDLSEVHGDAGKMARAAAATFHLTGFPSAAVPFDLCVEAEALGAVVDYRAGHTFDFPRVNTPPYRTSDAFLKSFLPGAFSEDIRSLARIPIICQSISQLKHQIGKKAVISGVLSGPFTVLSTLVDNASLYAEMKRQPGLILESLSRLASFISLIGHTYREAGADLLTIHEMGGSPSLLGAKTFEQFVLPSLEELIQDLPAPRVLGVCGKITNVWAGLSATKAEALSIDQSNDLASLRSALPRVMLFGNLDPVGLLSSGESAEIRFAVWKAKSEGADAIWPGCDLVPATPPENIRALMG